MGYILLCIILNVILFIIFKLFDKYEIKRFPAIVINYLTCVGLGMMFCYGRLSDLIAEPPRWAPYTLLLGGLFITGFYFISYSISHTGMALTTLGQRLSFLGSVLFGYLFFQETLYWYQGIAILFGLLAVIFVSIPQHSKETGLNSPKDWTSALPLLVFGFSSAIEILIFYLSKSKISPVGDYAVSTSIFFAAFISGGIVWLVSRQSFATKDVLAGIILGVPNFYSIHFLFQALHSDIPGSIIVPILNLGILMLASLIGVSMFRESLSLIKKIGLLLASLAVLLFIL